MPPPSYKFFFPLNNFLKNEVPGDCTLKGKGLSPYYY